MTENDMDVLARTIWGEARGENEQGKKAVVNVIFNRFSSGKWFAGKTIADTCQKPWQFSCWNKSDPNRKKMEALTYIELKPYFELIREVEQAKVDLVNGATHYYAPKVVACPKWAKGIEPCAKVGNHLFFKDID